MSYDLIIFDCDGTLVDTEALQNLATIQVLHEEGLTQYTLDYALKNFVGVRFGQTLKNIEAETNHQFPYDMPARYVARVAELMQDRFKVVEGAVDLVMAASAVAKICVASNGQRESVLKSLEMGGLIDLFEDDHIFTGLQVPNAKPAPDLFLMAAKNLGVLPAKTLVIEDSVVGVTAGVAAGMDVYGFVGASHDKNAAREALKKVGAKRVYDTLIHIQNDLISHKSL